MAEDYPAEPVSEPKDQACLKVLVRAYRVTGRVQGVGFRWFTSRVAKELDISGTVQNHPDGSVRVHAKGAPALLDQLEARIGRGPAAARVEAVESMEPSQVVKTGGFRIERTQ